MGATPFHSQTNFFFTQTNLAAARRTGLPSSFASRSSGMDHQFGMRGTGFAPSVDATLIEQIMVPGERTNWDPPRRGQRFALRLPVWYRSSGETDWHPGTTENISYSGALIQAAASSAPTAPLEIVIALPSRPSKRGGCLVGQGRVVRSVPQPSETVRSAFAVAVTQYRFERSEHFLDTIKT